jgi:hypothetical protein
MWLNCKTTNSPGEYFVYELRTGNPVNCAEWPTPACKIKRGRREEGKEESRSREKT